MRISAFVEKQIEIQRNMDMYNNFFNIESAIIDLNNDDEQAIMNSVNMINYCYEKRIFESEKFNFASKYVTNCLIRNRGKEIIKEIMVMFSNITRGNENNLREDIIMIILEEFKYYLANKSYDLISGFIQFCINAKIEIDITIIYGISKELDDLLNEYYMKSKEKKTILQIAFSSPFSPHCGYSLLKMIKKYIEELLELDEFDETILKMLDMVCLDEKNVIGIFEQIVILVPLSHKKYLIDHLNTDDIYQELLEPSSLSYRLVSFMIEGDYCPFSIEEVLNQCMNTIFDSYPSIQISAGICFSTIGTLYPQLFYSSFLNVNEDDNDENPCLDNYARAVGYLLQINNENLLIELLSALDSIGKYFYSQDQIHEFREGMDFYYIDEKVNTLTSSNFESVADSAELFYLTYIKGLFSIE